MKNKKILIISIVAFTLLASGTVYALVGRNPSSGGPEASPVMTTERGQTIDMSPGTEEDNQEINEKKVPGGMDDKPIVSDTIQVTITRTNQDSAKTLQVRSLLSGLTAGTCRLTLSKGYATIEKTAPVSLQNTGYVCDGFDIAASEFAGNSGNWSLELSVASTDNKTQSVQQDITIEL
jgi:hypothetical protein